MVVDLAFFDGEILLCRGSIQCCPHERTTCFSDGSHNFAVTYMLEEPSSPICIVCTRDGEQLYSAALQMGVHTSQDWESINLGNIHTLAFWCNPSRGGST